MLILSLANESGRVRPVTVMQWHNNERLGEKKYSYWGSFNSWLKNILSLEITI